MSRIYEALRKAQESHSKSKPTSAGGLGVMEMPDRRRHPRPELGKLPASDLTSNEAPVQVEISTFANLDPDYPRDTLRVPPAPTLTSGVDVSLPFNDNFIGSIALSNRKVAEALEMAFSDIVEEVAKATGPAGYGLPEDTEITSVNTAAENIVSTTAFPMQETIAAAEYNPSLLTDNGTAEVSSFPAQEMAEVILPSGLVACAQEQPSRSGFLTFYGLNQQPFDVTPDPAYLYLSRLHREALTALSQGIENLRGFMTLVADPGLGKTTLLNKLTEELGGRARVVHLFQTQCNSNELLRYLLDELEVDYDATDVVAMHRILNELLLQEMLQGKRFVLIVDEAQNLQEPVLETVRLLSNFETTHSKLIQIILAGQPGLVHTLSRPGLSQLRQRIAMVARLKPLGGTEVAECVEHRLRTAGSSGKPVFTPEALQLIAKRSKGVPRSINNLCFNALTLGYSMKREIIDIEIAERTAKNLDLDLLGLLS